MITAVTLHSGITKVVLHQGPTVPSGPFCSLPIFQRPFLFFQWLFWWPPPPPSRAKQFSFLSVFVFLFVWTVWHKALRAFVHYQWVFLSPAWPHPGHCPPPPPPTTKTPSNPQSSIRNFVLFFLRGLWQFPCLALFHGFRDSLGLHFRNNVPHINTYVRSFL